MTITEVAAVSTGATLLANVRLADGGIADLRMAEGVIDAIGPGLEAAGAEVIDGGGRLALPAMIDGHVHLDKTLTGLPWMPYPAGPDRASRIATERGLRAQLPPPAERASNLVRQAVAAGTTAFRSHADIGPDIGLRHVEALLEVKAAFAHAADFQIVEVFVGNDDVRDTWSPYGNGDLLVRAMLLSWRSGFRADGDLAIAFDCTSAAARRVFGHDDRAIALGAPADLFTVHAETLGEAVAQHPPRGLVFKGGQLVARDGVYLG